MVRSRFNRRGFKNVSVNPEASILFSVARPFVLSIRIERYTDDQISEQEMNSLLEKLKQWLEREGYRIFDERLSDRHVYLYVVRREVAQKAEEYLKSTGVDVEKLKTQSPLAESSDEELSEEPEIEVEPGKLIKLDS